MPLSPEARRAKYAAEHPPQEPAAPIVAQCKKCGKDFKRNPRQKTHEFCGDRCRIAWHRDGGTAFPQLLERVKVEVDRALTERAIDLTSMKTYIDMLKAEMVSVRADQARIQQENSGLVIDLVKCQRTNKRIQKKYAALIALNPSLGPRGQNKAGRTGLSPSSPDRARGRRRSDPRQGT